MLLSPVAVIALQYPIKSSVARRVRFTDMERDTDFDRSSLKQNPKKKLRPHAIIDQDKPGHRRAPTNKYLQEWQEESRGESDAWDEQVDDANNNIGYRAVSIICLICCTLVIT